VVGRDKEDPVLTEYVRERLRQLLAENGPRRARAGEPAVGARGFDPAEEEDGFDDEPVLPGPRETAPVPVADEELKPELPLALAVRTARVPTRRLFSRAHIVVVSGLLLIGLLWAGWAMLRARPVAIASPPLVRGSAAPSTLSPSVPPAAGRASSAATIPTRIMVHVLGAVQKPGVVSLPERARVQDAIRAAGGLSRDAAPAELNLAQVLDDGQQIMIGTAKKPSGEVRDGSGNGPAGSSTGPQSGSANVVNLNSATQPQLEDLPGVGPVTAAKILSWRAQHGRFSRVEELQEVDGIGPKTYAQIAPRARV
jgi:competence protein ComEA